ncbi:FMN-binding protein [Tissierella creatinophila]|uniref:Ion-translocating oxidoreductase complex subunit G n=1 Tax=Tissierella creatinophila DSM 6911 TaxID=1123403 RepID=A0A1U7M7Q7_TISCR|nr:FMN-binding protein [Tissierella creatinophila]OLS03315.1 electron transport complex subunit RnfG [Tissierella creatinophila DSM 6911]
MKETIKLGLVLFIFTAIAGGVLALTNDFTSPIIAEIEKEASFNSLAKLFPEADDFKEIDEELLGNIKGKYAPIIEAHEALKGGETIGYSFKTESSGYGDSPIVAITAIKSDGTLAGIELVSHSETPGFGKQMEEDKFKDTFKGKTTETELIPVESPSSENEVMLITGSTISSKGILTGVNAAREVYRENFSN